MRMTEAASPGTPPLISAPVAAALWMLMGVSSMAVLNLVIQLGSRELHPFQIAFFRCLFGLAFMLPWAFGVGLSGLRTGRLGLYTTRSLTGLAAMLSWFLGVSLMPLAEAVTLGFTTPLFVTIGAALFLGETVRARRWTAVGIGFAGVLLVMRPGAEAVSWPALLVLVSCGFAGASALQVRTLARTESTAAMVTYMSLLMTPMTLLPALFVWRWPSAWALGLMVLAGGLASLGQFGISRALGLAEASQVTPVEYAKLPVSALLGWLAFGQAMDWPGWLGAAVIAASTLYVTHREAALARAARRA
jgi:S-adenosylmethionine uptake transporter